MLRRIRPLPQLRVALACRRLALGAALGLACSAYASEPRTDAIAQTVSDYLLAQTTHLPGIPQIHVDATSAARHPACDAPEAFLPPGTRLRTRMSVGVRCATPSSWTAYVQAQLSVPGDAWVAARTIDAGQPITREDLTTRSGDLLALPANAVLAPEQAIGAIATRRIPAGRELRTDALRSADAILRGQQVKLIVHGQGFTATGEGQAVAAAEPGMPVQVRTPSGQIVSGIVRDALTVEVPL